MSSGSIALRSGPPEVLIGWCASTSKLAFTGQATGCGFSSAFMHSTSRQNARGRVRTPPGGSPYGAVPAVTTTLSPWTAFTEP